jgi:hypothetical protein
VRWYWYAGAGLGAFALLKGGQSLLYSAQVVRMAKAISFAEGTFDANGNPITGSLGYQLNNPLDIEDSTGNLVQYATLDDGWHAGYHQVDLMLSGKSHVYKPNWAIVQVAGEYTGGDNPLGWASAVAQYLGISINSTLADVGALSV